jgi:hypothetical protein
MCGRSGSQGPLLSRFYHLLLLLLISVIESQSADHCSEDDHFYEGETEAALSTFAYISR